MSSRRNGSVSRAAETASKNRLHMDRNPQHSRINDPSNPAGRRKEIDNVMKRARQGSPGSWDRKLLEVEEKDPNRWRHTGYKQMYLEGGGSVSPRRSRSPVPRRVSRSPLGRSPPARTAASVRRKSRSPRRTPRRSPRRTPIRRNTPPARSPRRRSPRPRSPPRRESPRPRSPVRRESPRPRARPPPPTRRPPSPPEPRKSTSGSSGSSCSDESCSVCSAKNKKGPPPPPKGAKIPASSVGFAKVEKGPSSQPPKGAKIASRPTSKSPVRSRAGPASTARAVQPTRELLKAREGSKRSREEKVLEWQRSQLAVRPAPAPGPVPIPGVHIKREGSPGAPTDPRRRPRVSPAAIAAALNESESDSDSEPSDDQQPQRLTLSERFGKMAQWSADRSARLENMRITRREARLHVRIERDPDAPPSSALPGVEPVAPEGSYPEELLSAAPGGLPSWDDVTVRYDYYKKRGYLRGLTLGDYVKWEEWWYKYQEWLERERAYERWAEEEARPARRDRRRKGGRHRRS